MLYRPWKLTRRHGYGSQSPFDTQTFQPRVYTYIYNSRISYATSRMHTIAARARARATSSVGGAFSYVYARCFSCCRCLVSRTTRLDISRARACFAPCFSKQIRRKPDLRARPSVPVRLHRARNRGGGYRGEAALSRFAARAISKGNSRSGARWTRSFRSARAERASALDSAVVSLGVGGGRPPRRKTRVSPRLEYTGWAV